MLNSCRRRDVISKSNDESDFDPVKFYESYPQKVILRPGYPARAQYKSTLMWNLYGKKIISSLVKIRSYADIGGCFGFGANAMAFHIKNYQEEYPKTKCFELSSDFIKIGKILFPYIDFVQCDILNYEGSKDPFDLVTMFDVIEHIPDPESFLSGISDRARFALLKTPMETCGDLFGAKPPVKQGYEHSDGHISFFTPKKYLKLIDKTGWDLIDGIFVRSIVNLSNYRVLKPESEVPNQLIKKTLYYLLLSDIIPYYFIRKILGGGDHLCLIKSRKYL